MIKYMKQTNKIVLLEKKLQGLKKEYHKHEMTYEQTKQLHQK